MISCFRTVAKRLHDLKLLVGTKSIERMSPRCTRELRLGSSNDKGDVPDRFAGCFRTSLIVSLGRGLQECQARGFFSPERFHVFCVVVWDTVLPTTKDDSDPFVGQGPNGGVVFLS